MRAHLIQIDALDGAADPLVLRLSSHDLPEVCHLNGAQWTPSIARLPRLRYDLFGGSFNAAISSPTASFAVATDLLGPVSNMVLAGARVRVWSGDVGQAFASYLLRFDGRIGAEPAWSEGVLEVEAATDGSWLDKPLLATYTGAGGIEGPQDLQGTPKPLVLGNARFVPGVLIDAVDSVYQVSSYGAVQGITAAYDRLVSLGAVMADYASLAALLAATIPAGRWATCKAQGLVRLGAPPDGKVCFDVQGDAAGAGGYVRKAGAMIGRVVELAGGTVTSANLTALDAARAWNQAIVISSQTTARVVVQELADSVAAVAGMSWTGSLFVQPLAIGAPTLTLDAEGGALPLVANVVPQPVAPPFWRLATSAEITWTVHDQSEIASEYIWRGDYSASRTYRLDDAVTRPDQSAWLYISATPSSGNAPPAWPTTSNAWWDNIAPPATAADIAYGDGTPIEDLQPAEPGATEGATLPDPDGTGGNITDPGGTPIPPGLIRNDLMELTPSGLLRYSPTLVATPINLGQITLPAMGAASEFAVNQANEQLDLLASTVLRLTTEASFSRTTMRDAGIAVDPTTGIARIHAVDQVHESLSEVDIRLSAAESNILLRASYTYVDEQIALAVIDPSQIAELEEIFLRLGVAEVDINALEASVALLATQVDVSAIEARVTNAEIDIDALNATIVLKVDTTTFDALETRVDSAETTLSAIGNTAEITDAVRVARLSAAQRDEFGTALLNAILNEDRNQRGNVDAIAEAHRQLTATIGDGLTAEVTERLALTARVGTAEAGLSAESTARASADAALAGQYSTLSAELDDEIADRHAAILAEETARVDGDEALAETVSTLAAALDDEEAARAAAVTAEAQARTSQDELLARDARGVAVALARDGQAAVSALFAGDDAKRAAQTWVADARQEITARIVEGEEASAAQRFSLQVRIDFNEASLAAESIVRASADEALSGQISTLTATANGKSKIFAQATAPTVHQANDLWFDTDDGNKPYRSTGAEWVATDDARIDVNTAAISTEATARANADSALAGQISTVSAVAGAKNKVFVQAGPPTATAVNDLWIETDNNNKSWTWSGAAWVAADDARIAAALAAISSEAVTRADADGALASEISTVSTTVDGHAASITSFNESIDGLEARAGLRMEVGGFVSGYVLNNDGEEGSFRVLADNFSIEKPGGGTRTEFINGVWRTVTTSTILAHGEPFGTSAQFVHWYGPRPAGDDIALCSETDALFYIRVDGAMYFGGAVPNMDNVTISAIGVARDNTFTQVGSIITTTTSSVGSITATWRGSASLFYGTNANYEFKLQYSLNKVSWTDIAGTTKTGTAIASPPVYPYDPVADSSGTAGALTAHRIYYVRMVARITSAAIPAPNGLTFSGTVNAQGT